VCHWILVEAIQPVKDHVVSAGNHFERVAKLSKIGLIFYLKKIYEEREP